MTFAIEVNIEVAATFAGQEAEKLTRSEPGALLAGFAREPARAGGVYARSAGSVAGYCSQRRRTGVGCAVGPFDDPAADLTDRCLRVVLGEHGADEGVGQDVSLTVSATPAGDKSVDRVKVTAQPVSPQQRPTLSELPAPQHSPWAVWVADRAPAAPGQSRLAPCPSLHARRPGARSGRPARLGPSADLTEPAGQHDRSARLPHRRRWIRGPCPIDGHGGLGWALRHSSRCRVRCPVATTSRSEPRWPPTPHGLRSAASGLGWLVSHDAGFLQIGSSYVGGSSAVPDHL